MTQSNTITREQLYDMVWSEPLSKLAKKYIISDKGLAKICKRMEIIRPPVGYWNRFNAGNLGKKPALPKPSKKCVMEVKLRDFIKKEPEKLSKEMQEVLDFENKPENLITKPSELVDPAKIVLRTQKAFNNAKPDTRGILEPKSSNHLALKVTRDSIDRAILLYDVLFRQCEKRGHKLVLKTIEEKSGHYWYKRHETYIAVGNDKFYISINEKINHVPHVVTAEEKEKLKLKKAEEKKYGRAQRSNRLIYGFNDNINYSLLNFSPRKTDYIPSGKLSLKIVSLESSYKRFTWTDTTKRDIFSQLNDFFIGLEYGVEYFKQKIVNEKLRKIEEEECYRQRRIEEDKRRCIDQVYNDEPATLISLKSLS